MSYSEKESLKHLAEASNWPKFSGTGKYDDMGLIYYIDRIFIDLPSIQDYLITARFNIEFKGHAMVSERNNLSRWSLNKTQRRVAEVTKKKNSCHNCGSTDHYANNFPKEKKKVYAMEKVPEEESPTEDSESDSRGDAIREQSDEDQYPREEFLVEYQEETPLEIQ
ncbi:hypothetical protein O181_011348 [Austropuccinia psidii MF-1]|uniref:Uncharacterized protein n=1 Tax=Austropuccinia psidii MF-1 TaxID=1389203 RepID=A0A9Q3BUN9_9BASI|nr:hypothetical protein [Austropuccinia psidii MF-1]